MHLKSHKSSLVGTITILVLIILILVVCFFPKRQGTIPEKPKSTETTEETIPQFAFVDDIASVILTQNGSEKIGCELNGVDIDLLNIKNENPEIADISIDQISSEGVSINITALSSGVGYFSISDGTNSSERICVVVEETYNESNTGTYIANTQTHVFHKSDCSSLPDSDNREYVSYSEATSKGYTPCKICNP